MCLLVPGFCWSLVCDCGFSLSIMCNVSPFSIFLSFLSCSYFLKLPPTSLSITVLQFSCSPSCPSSFQNKHKLIFSYLLFIVNCGIENERDKSAFIAQTNQKNLISVWLTFGRHQNIITCCQRKWKKTEKCCWKETKKRKGRPMGATLPSCAVPVSVTKLSSQAFMWFSSHLSYPPS